MLSCLRKQVSRPALFKPTAAAFYSYVKETPEIVKIPYEDLISKKGSYISEKIEKAYSDKGLGILLVEGIPTFAQKRVQLLRLS